MTAARLLRRAPIAVVVGVMVSSLASVPAARAAEPGDVNSLGLSATYDVEATFGWDDRHVSVRTSARVTNDVRWSVSVLAFNLAPLRTGDARLRSIAVDGASVAASVDDQTILVPLTDRLHPAQTTTIEIEYAARLNARSSIESDDWLFARIGDVLTAYRWIPWLSRTTPFDRPNVGDPFVTASSPMVRVSVTTDRAATFATSGRLVASDGLTHVFEAADVRDFNLAASPRYRTRATRVGSTEVTFFYLSLPPESVLATAARAIRDFEARIGPHPREQLAIAEVGPWAPFESPAHFWLPSNASPRLLSWMVAHEVAHEWFYSAVGSDQAREPFADEAIADLMARSLLGRFVESPCPTGRLDHSIYTIGECYPWVIYVQGAAWLRRVRDTVGAGRFWQGVAAYYAERRLGMGSNHALVAALYRVAGRDAIDHRRFPYLLPPRLVSLPLAPSVR